jgi:hypothetical protein
MEVREDLNESRGEMELGSGTFWELFQCSELGLIHFLATNPKLQP